MKIKISSIVVAMFIQSVAADDSLIINNIELCNSKDNEACYNVGNAYYFGEGAKKNYKKASEYFDKACLLQHLIGCAALSYITPLLKLETITPSKKKEYAPKPQTESTLKKETALEPQKKSILLNPLYFEFLRLKDSTHITPDKLRLWLTRKYPNYPEEVIDLLIARYSMFFKDKRFTWVVYKDLINNNLINAVSTLDEFWSIYSERANEILDYLFAKYHYVLSDDEIEALYSYKAQVFNAFYEKKKYNTCKKFIIGDIGREESFELQKELDEVIPAELCKKKIQAELNLIKAVLYKNELNKIKNKYAELDKPESDALYRKILEKSNNDLKKTLSKQEAAFSVERENKGNQADAQSLCKLISEYFDKYMFNSNRDIKEKRLIFVKSKEQLALSKKIDLIEDEIKKIRQDESIIDREYLSNQKITDKKYFYEQSCALKEGDSCTYLGILYETGNGVYETGNGVQPNLDVAIKYYEKACNLNDGIGCFGLGRQLSFKTDLKEKIKALHLFEKACDLDLSNGCVEAANQYYSGTVVANDSKYAQLYYEKGCDLRDSEGCRSLGIMYEEGKIVPRNLALAKEYYEKACTLGDKICCDSISQIDKLSQ